MIAGERKSGKPSELADLKRTSANRLGFHSAPPVDRLPDAAEQAVIQGGHLLSAAAGAVFAAAVDEDAAVVPSGIASGLAVYAAMHWIMGSLLGVKKPEWQPDASAINIYAANHVPFGIATAAGAKLAVGA